VKRAALLVVTAALACGSNPSTIPSGDFSGPSGLAIAPLADRDLLFIANQGSNELRALTLCHIPNPFSCPTNQDFQFLPGPIRVFVGSILTGERPLRLAGVPLSDGTKDPSDPTGNTFIANHGAVFATSLGAPDSSGNTVPALQLFDAANLLFASQSKNPDGTVPVSDPQTITLTDAPVDVAASTVPNATVAAFAVSQPSDGSPRGTLTMLAVTIAAGAGPAGSGLAHATPTGQCTIDFAPTRLAMIPGRDDFVYIADGTIGGTPGGVGDGIVEIPTASIAAAGGGACPGARRIPASDPLDSPRRARPLKSIAISPASLDGGGNKLDAGHTILGVTSGDPALCANHSVGVCPAQTQPLPPGTVCVDQGIQNCGEGRIVILSNDPGNTSDLFRAPGVPGTANLPMEPLRAPGAAREVTFMGRNACPPPFTQSATAPDARCTALRVGVPLGTPVALQRSVIGVVSTIDGTTLFIDPDNVRFFDDLRDGATGTAPFPSEAAQPQLVPQPPPGVAPSVFMLAPKDATNPHKSLNDGWMNSGVTRSASWRAVWHATIPGLESISGELTRDTTTPGSPITLTLPTGKDLTPFINSPEIQLGAGDFVRVISYPATTSATCSDFAVAPITTEIPIIAVNPRLLVLQSVPGFDPGPSCFPANVSVGGTFEVRVGDTAAGGWIILEDLDVLGRLVHGGPLFVVSGNRFDYPIILRDANNNFNAPQPGPKDIALAFSVTGPEPTSLGTSLSVFISSGGSLTSVRDITSAGAPGYAGPILVYSSKQRQVAAPGLNDELLFTALTGSNSLLFAIPAQFGLSGSFQMFY
jgi:hypothetical protein